MRIDVHCHLVPESLLQTLSDAGLRFPGLFPFSGTPATGPIASQGGDFRVEQLYSIEQRLRDMAAQQIDMHVISPAPQLFFYDREPGEALDLCRKVNDALAEVVATNPKSFVAIADLPMQSPDDAAAELERAVRELGLRGAEICSNINGLNLDDKRFAVVYAKAQELDVPIFIHPQGVPGLEERLGSYYLTNLIGNPMDTTIAAASLVFGGVLKEFPRLKFYLAHGGGACPYICYRWDHGWSVRREGKVNIERAPSEYFKALYFDSLTHGGPALSFLAATVGPERIMLGTDYPFDMGDYSAVKAVGSIAGLADAEKDLILGENAARLFRIDV